MEGPAALQAALAASLQCPSSMKPARSHSSQSCRCAEVAPATCQQADKAQAGYDVQSSQQCVEVCCVVAIKRSNRADGA
eukprot:13010-Heterococcus_DN1.PRE.2